MSKVHIRTERRSLRLWINIPVRASSKNADGKEFSEDTETIDNRKVGESAVAERHVRSDDGFKIAERRSASVAANRRETEKVFADRRKKSSVNR